MFTLEWIQSPDLRRRVHLGLNKGEARNSLAWAIFFYRRGAVRDRLREDLQNKASGLNLVVAAIVLWNTVYLEQAVAALERQGTPIPAECLKGYLFTIARNLFLQGLRKKSRYVGLSDELPDSQASPHEQAEQKEKLDSVLAELQKLPEASRAALLLHAVYGLPYDEIARVLDVSLFGSESEDPPGSSCAGRDSRCVAELL